MREIAALVVLLAASRLINLESKEPEFLSGLALLACLGALVFLAASLAERLNPKIKKWHRINPGKRTQMDEAEWERIGRGGSSPPMPKKTPSEFAAPPGAAAPPNLNPKKAPMFYDSGFDSSAGKKAPEGPDQFDEIFGDGENDSSR